MASAHSMFMNSCFFGLFMICSCSESPGNTETGGQRSAENVVRCALESIVVLSEDTVISRHDNRHKRTISPQPLLPRQHSQTDDARLHSYSLKTTRACFLVISTHHRYAASTYTVLCVLYMLNTLLYIGWQTLNKHVKCVQVLLLIIQMINIVQINIILMKLWGKIESLATAIDHKELNERELKGRQVTWT